MNFSKSITDPEKLRGLMRAREEYNAALPEATKTVELEPAVPPSEENPAGIPAKTEQQPIVPKPGTLDDDGYLNMVLDRAMESWAKQYPA